MSTRELSRAWLAAEGTRDHMLTLCDRLREYVEARDWNRAGGCLAQLVADHAEVADRVTEPEPGDDLFG